MTRDTFYRKVKALARAHEHSIAPGEAESLECHLADLSPRAVYEALDVLEKQAVPHRPFPSILTIRKIALEAARDAEGYLDIGQPPCDERRPLSVDEGADPAPVHDLAGKRRCLP